MALYSRNVLVLPELIYTLGLHSSWCNELHNLIMCSLKYFLLSVFKIFLDNSIGISYCEEQQVIICLSTPSVILWISIHILLHSPTALHPQSRFRLLLILKLFCQHFLDTLYLFFEVGVPEQIFKIWLHQRFISGVIILSALFLFFPLPCCEPFTYLLSLWALN